MTQRRFDRERRRKTWLGQEKAWVKRVRGGVSREGKYLTFRLSNERTCIIVVEILGQGGSLVMGVVVDTVSEVLNIKVNEIEETPSFGTKLETDYILGMAKMNGGVKILLDIDKVLSAEELEILDKAA
jgi:chemotaxis signal transduction protein